MVNRYDCKGAVVTHEAGPFVLYEDYAVLEEKLKSLAHAIVNAGLDPVGSPDFELAESVVSDN